MMERLSEHLQCKSGGPSHIQLQDHEGKKSPLTLQSVDVINDLAIVKRETIQSMPFFSLATKAPMKGEELYSLGNPHDLGMIVVPGTYNGLKKRKAQAN